MGKSDFRLSRGVRALCVAVILVAGSLEPIKNNTGATVGYLDRKGERTFVKDRCFQTMGYLTEKGTFNDTRARKSQSPLPYLLLQSSQNVQQRRLPHSRSTHHRNTLLPR